MIRIHLKDFAKARGQPEAASLLGVTQGALSKAIRVGRDVLVVENPDGSFSAFETRSFPSRKDRISSPCLGPTLSQTILRSLLSAQSDDPPVRASSARGGKLDPPESLAS